jgi:hypothetical protein
MANTFKFGNKQWYGKKGSVLAYNDENNNFKPLPFDFTRSSSATRVNKDGLIEVVGSDEPRVDYLNNADGHLLLEPSRTNKLTDSEDFSSYSTSGTVSTTPNYGISPSGEMNSTRVVLDANSALYKFTAHSVNEEYSSIYVKGVSGETIKFGRGTTVNAGEIFTLTGDWQRLEDTSTTGNQFSINTFTGVTARDIEIWGGQVEEGSYATSYIPTSGSSVTRAVDRIEQSGFQGKVLNATQGTIFIHFNNPMADGDNNDFHMFRSTSSTGIENGFLYRLNTGTGVDILERVANSTGAQFSNIVSKGQVNKIAISFTSSTLLGSANGSTKSYSGTYLGTEIDIDEFENSGSTEQGLDIIDIKFYDTALTQEELNALTTL